MSNFLYKILLTAVGVGAFSSQDKGRNKIIFFSVIGGILTFTAETVMLKLSENTFLIYMFAAAVTCAFSEFFARILKVPATILLLPSVIPIVPGYLLYFGMKGLILGDYEQYRNYSALAIQTAAGIAVAIVCVSLLARFCGILQKH